MKKHAVVIVCVFFTVLTCFVTGCFASTQKSNNADLIKSIARMYVDQYCETVHVSKVNIRPAELLYEKEYTYKEGHVITKKLLRAYLYEHTDHMAYMVLVIIKQDEQEFTSNVLMNMYANWTRDKLESDLTKMIEKSGY